MVKKLLKWLVKKAPVALTKNELYDRLTEIIVQKVCGATDVCVDVGANDGKVLAMFIKHCPKAMHLAFEPLPHFFKLLVRKYGSACHVYPTAIASKKGTAEFIFVKTNAAYSGLRTRPYPKNETIEHLNVATDTLDNMIGPITNVKLIKLDIEGGEFDALVGGIKIIDSCYPVILFEFGQGGSTAYGITADVIFSFFSARRYRVYTLQKFIKNKPSLSLQQLEHYYQTGDEYFFVASLEAK